MKLEQANTPRKACV